VTPAAISHQIRTLEARLGALLFDRSAQGVILPEQGELLYRQTHHALLAIHRSLDVFYPEASVKILTLSTTPALAATWLIPRLGNFYRTHARV